MAEVRNFWGMPMLVCDHCKGAISTDEIVVIDCDKNYHGQCYDEIKQAEKPKEVL